MDSGQDKAEYALLVGLIAAIVFVAVVVLGEHVMYFFEVLGNAIASFL